MVYNDAYLAPASLTEKLRAKFGDRAAGAIFRASSKCENGEVFSFFGRTEEAPRGRAVPTAKKVRTGERPAARQSRPQVRQDTQVIPAVRVNRGARVDRHTARSLRADTVEFTKVNPRTAAKDLRREREAQAKAKAARTARPAPRISKEEAAMRASGLFGKAYTAGDRVKKMTARVRIPSADRYKKKKIPKELLRRGRAEFAGSRHAALKSDFGASSGKSLFERFKDSIRDIQKAEHRVKNTPLPIAYAAIVVVCAVMAMVLILSQAQVSEREGMIGDLSSKYSQLADTTAKLELKLEERDDIRKIEQIAVGEIGMVSSDMATSKFVSVSADDKVEILREETEEEDGAFSALLSAIGESIGKFSEYFN